MEYVYNLFFPVSDKLEEYQFNRNLSDINTITEYDDIGEKNFSYYTGKRYFKISRKLYPQYTRGYIYGYYEDLDYGICDDNNERTF